MKRLLLILPFVLFLSGCVTRPVITPENNVSGTEWSLASATEALAGDDPIEPFNRSMFMITDVGMRWVVRPVGWVYGSILPREVIQRVDYASDNLEFPGRMVSCFLQAKWKGGCIELGRFLVNSTVGIAGLFDPAEYYLGWYRRPENMGHAFAKWGIGPGGLFYFPFCRFTNPRDCVGFIFDSVLDIKNVIPYAGSVSAVNRAVNSYDGYDTAVESVQDEYEYSKMGLVGMRFAAVNDYQFRLKDPPPAPEQKDDLFRPKAPLVSIRKQFEPYHPLVDTLRSALFTMQHDHDSWWIKTSLWNTDFSNIGKIVSIREKPDEPGRHFQFWHNPKNPKYKNTLVLIIPGIGTSYTGRMPRALAELLYFEGYDPVVTSSTMNWLFAVSQDSAFPGYIPDDVKRLRKHLRGILDCLQTKYELHPEKIIVVGASLGAIQALHLARMESEENTLGISRYIALNPPVDLLYALEQFDMLSSVSRKWTRQEFFDQTGDALAKYLPFVQRAHPCKPVESVRPMKVKGVSMADFRKEDNDHVYLSVDQASVMIGLSLRMTLRELIASAHRNGFVPGQKLDWSRRFAFYRLHDARSSKDYFQRYVLVKYPGKTMEELAWNSGLRKMQTFLKNSDSVRVIHNIDDPLLSTPDRIFLDRTLGQKLLWFDAGGHMGNMYMVRWQKEFLKMVRINGNK